MFKEKEKWMKAFFSMKNVQLSDAGNVTIPVMKKYLAQSMNINTSQLNLEKDQLCDLQ